MRFEGKEGNGRIEIKRALGVAMDGKLDNFGVALSKPLDVH